MLPTVTGVWRRAEQNCDYNNQDENNEYNNWKLTKNLNFTSSFFLFNWIKTCLFFFLEGFFWLIYIINSLNIEFFSGWLKMCAFLNFSVPVETVEIQPFNNTELFEGREKRFVCLVGKSKPSPQIEWVINKESGSSRNVTSNAKIFHEASGKFFESKSVLKLTLHRSFKTLLCKATVANLPWVESANMELDVTRKYST